MGALSVGDVRTGTMPSLLPSQKHYLKVYIKLKQRIAKRSHIHHYLFLARYSDLRCGHFRAVLCPSGSAVFRGFESASDFM
ncbi:MAG: hypothetical protein V1736_12025 [Pseudomonadota bacterium]